MPLGTLQDVQKNSYRDSDLGAGLTKQAVEIENDSSNPFPIVIIDSITAEVINIFGSVSAVASSSETTVVSYTVPVGKVFFIKLVEGGGENIALYRAKVNAFSLASKRSYFGSSLDVCFDFSSTQNRGLKLVAGDVLLLSVEHIRPDLGNFEARILGVLDDA